MEIGLSAKGIVTDNHSANVNSFSALKNIQFRMKLLYRAPAVAKHAYFMKKPEIILSSTAPWK